MTRLLLALMTCLLIGVYGAVARPFTDAAGRKVEIPDRISRAFAAGPPASVLIYALAPDKLAGWVRAPSAAEKPYLIPSVRDLPTSGRLTGKGGITNMQAVLAAKPDIIIDIGTVDATYAALADKVQAQTGIPYVLIDGSFARSGAALRDVGGLLGIADRANTLAAYTDETIGALNDKFAGLPADKRPHVYYGRGPDGLETGLAGSINLEMLDAAGAVNVAAASGRGGLVQVSREQVLSWNPDTILAETDTFAKALRTDPAWARVAAVRNGRVFVPPALPFGWFDSPPGINRLIGIRWLAHVLYPEIFPDDLSADVRKFYQLFYQVSLTDEQLAALLKHADMQPD